MMPDPEHRCGGCGGFCADCHVCDRCGKHMDVPQIMDSGDHLCLGCAYVFDRNSSWILRQWGRFLRWLAPWPCEHKETWTYTKSDEGLGLWTTTRCYKCGYIVRHRYHPPYQGKNNP